MEEDLEAEDLLEPIDDEGNDDGKVTFCILQTWCRKILKTILLDKSFAKYEIFGPF